MKLLENADAARDALLQLLDEHDDQHTYELELVELVQMATKARALVEALDQRIAETDDDGD